MAIRYDKNLNAELRNTVRNFNKKVVRAEQRGFRNLPRLEKVSELKARYDTRSDLIRELRRLKNFNRGDILRKVENDGGAKAVEWEFDFLKGNIKNARDYFTREYERVSRRTGRFPGERMMLDTISSKLNLLNRDINYLSQSEFRSAVAATREFQNAFANLQAQYRGFLSEVEWVMDNVGISRERKDEFFAKFKNLTPSQFLYAYDNNDIIGRIYALYRKNEDGGAELTDSEENAEDLIDNLMEEADQIVIDAKANAD